jgi:hypothetical protein
LNVPQGNCVFATKTNPLMPFEERVHAYFDNDTGHTDTTAIDVTFILFVEFPFSCAALFTDLIKGRCYFRHISDCNFYEHEKNLQGWVSGNLYYGFVRVPPASIHSRRGRLAHM